MMSRVVILLFSLLVSGVWSNSGKADRKMILRNNSGRRVEMNWIHPQTGARALMTQPDILNGAEFNMDSFVSHKFELKELPSKRTGKCMIPEDCKIAFFAVNDNEKQVIEIDRDFNLRHEDHKSIANDVASGLIAECRKNATESLKIQNMDKKAVLSALTDCMRTSVIEEFLEIADEIAFQSNVRKSMGQSYENYTCADYDLPSTQSLENTTWYHHRSRKSHHVQIMLDRPASRIHVVDDFISEQECNAMNDAARDLLRPAVVGDGAGGHELSKSRKAMQAGIHVPWAEEASGHPIATISRKVYDYVNHVTGLDIDEKGQEDLMSIQYFGRGENDTEPDHYKPHCDGECTGDEHKNGTRVATIVMYCTVPTKGGATNFRNSGIHVMPKVGRAVFFSYMNPDTHMMDSGFTEHSGCPVIEGEKKIVTQWVRHGVTAEVPWSRYNSLGLLEPEIELDENGFPKDNSWVERMMAKMKTSGIMDAELNADARPT